MTKRPDAVAAALKSLAETLEATGPAETTLQAQYGWNFAPLDRSDLARLAHRLAGRLEQIDPSAIGGDYSQDVYVARIELFKANTLPQIWSGNGAAALPVYFQLLEWIDCIFRPFYTPNLDWKKLDDQKLLPRSMSNRLRSHQSRIERLDVDLSTLDEKIKTINHAHQAANELPTDLEELRAAKTEVATNRELAEKNKVLAEEALKRVEQLVALVAQHESEAKKLVENTHDAYSAATTKGLGEAFQKRADRLAKSMWIWVCGLVSALAAGAIVGAFRISALQALLAAEASTGRIALNLVLAFISVAAPVWFAWIATKQIGHRFRLSEDYAFKASVAQAYEGYRREAARLDEKFAKRLFSSALDRIDEAPIRFVEHETHGSPWHEILGRRATSSKRAGTQSPIQLLPTDGTPKSNGAPVDSAAD
ncbi:hypothetical protein D9M68_150650 [compost metagenome]